jgi:hypothetical protein
MRVGARLAGGVLLFLIIEALVFRSGYYTSLLEPSSSAGFLMTLLWNEQARPKSGASQVVGIGDSRIALRPRIANQLTPETRYAFASIAIGGSTPRCWYYMLREVDPDARAYKAIVIGRATYEDEDWEDLADNTRDLFYGAPLLRLGDVLPFSLSFPNWTSRWQVFRGSLLKGFTYKRDFQDFLVNHRGRMDRLRDTRKNSARQIYEAEWGADSLQGLTVDWTTGTIHFPDNLSPARRKAISDVLLGDRIPPNGLREAYHRLWFGRIADRYRGSPTKLIFIRLPRGPVVRPHPPWKMTSVVKEMASRREVIVADEHLFDDLERPELFGDGMHMNGPGGELFSLRLARLVPKLIEAAR